MVVVAVVGARVVLIVVPGAAAVHAVATHASFPQEPSLIFLQHGTTRHGSAQFVGIDDGLLDVVVIPPVPLWHLPYRLPQFLTGRHLKLPIVRFRKARRVRLEPRPGFPPYEVDGEILPSGPAEVRVLPQALRVIVPPLTSQYLNLAKNSSLATAIGYPDLVNVFMGTTLNQTGQAVEITAMTMAVYLTMSLTISTFMNWYNKRVALVER